MASDGSARKLAVILHADVVGSTDLVHRHEQLAHDRIQDTFQRFSETIGRYGGIVHEIRGDALLAECDRASDAVSAALACQAANTEHNNSLDGDIRPEVRIGISLGEVVIADSTLTGPDVVLAQRLEQLAEPGGVCISVEVQHALPGRLPFDYVDLGEQEVKGFDKPVRAYAVTLRSGEVIPAPEPRARVEKPAGTTKRQFATAGIIAAVLIAVGVAAWWQPWAPDVEPASVERMAFPLPEKPSVAVLPFDNMTGDPEQDFFVDAMTEGIITTLAKVPQLFVIARNSTFTYKGKPVEVRQVAEELGVRYVLEGSVQRSPDRIRLTAQLIDALTGHHVWAERYDTLATDLLTVQDEVAQKVVTALEVTLTEGEQRRLRRAETNSPEAWDYYVRGRQHHLRFTKADSKQARQLYFKALELDPQYASALAQVAWTHILHAWRGWSENPEQELKRAAEYVEQAIAIDDTNPDAIVTMATLAQNNNQYDKAVALGEKAVSLSPSGADGTALLASYFTGAGRHDEAVETIERAMRLAPYYPVWFLDIAGEAYFFQRNYDKAITAFEGYRDRLPNNPRSYARLASTYAEAGDEEAARAAAEELLSRDPKFSIKVFARSLNFKNPENLERILDGLRKAGLPE
jgi:TolB-like protein/class 3 adenylate cyclase/Tfp pilus assembly protein PilF